MSLIPSESHSFPDYFSGRISRARVLNEIKSLRPQIKPQPRRPRATATSLNGNERVQKRRPFGPVRAWKPVDVDLSPSSQVGMVSHAMENDFRPEQNLDNRRRRKMLRFIFAEVIALAVLIAAASLALLHRLTDQNLIFAANLVTIAASIAAAVLPIVFFAIAPTLPRDRR